MVVQVQRFLQSFEEFQIQLDLKKEKKDNITAATYNLTSEKKTSTLIENSCSTITEKRLT